MCVWGGGGLVGDAKKKGFKRGVRQKILGVKGGITKKILSSFAVTAVSVITESLSKEDGNGIQNVTQKVNSRCFKLHQLHRSYCNSFNSSNVGVFFQELNSIKDCIFVHKNKKTLSFRFLFCLLVSFFWGGSSQLSCEKKGGTLKTF